MRPASHDAAVVEPVSVPPSVSAYCRQARRLRGTLRHQPARMHRKLRELTVRPAPIDVSDDSPVAPASRHVTSKAHAFAEQVAKGLDGPVLRYVTRRALIRDAGRMGIGAFEANLIIAAVQHERRGGGVSTQAPQEPAPAHGLIGFGSLLVIFAVEAAVAFGAWRVFGA
jgi:hypothetical protein